MFTSVPPGRRTTHMPYLLVRQKCEDYKRWKPIFDEHGTTRQENGGHGGTLYRNADDPDEAVTLFKWDNLENARRYAQSEDLRDALQRAGVTVQPDVYFLEEVEKSDDRLDREVLSL
jgi:antibiotic biosynthesis monooxygenase (ABM) superfamily enzyme